MRAEYPANVPYTSEFVSFAADKTAFDLPISVYETTTDASGIRAERVHYIIEFDQGRALIAELIVMSLDGDRAYVGDGNHVLQIPLPPGAQELTVNEGELGSRFIQIDNGFVDRLALPPGQNVRQLLFRYALPYQGNTLDLVRSLPYPAAAVNALVSDAGEKVTSPDLNDDGRRDTQNGAYFNFSAPNLPANQQVHLNMTGLPDASGGGATGVAATGAIATGAGSLNRWLLVGLIALAAAVAALVVALLVMRNRPSAPAPSAEGGTPDRQKLVDMLARLELAYEAGQIGESVYQDERLRLKAQLRDLLREEARG